VPEVAETVSDAQPAPRVRLSGGRFAPGHPLLGHGRPRGARNKLALEAEAMLDEAWNKLGGAEFLVKCVTDSRGRLDRSSKNIPALLALFGRRVRTRVDVNVTTWAEIIDEAARSAEQRAIDTALVIDAKAVS
jgi:hypothetical protein